MTGVALARKGSAPETPERGCGTLCSVFWLPDLSRSLLHCLSFCVLVCLSLWCLPLSSTLSCLLGLFVGPHLCFILGNLVWGSVKCGVKRGRHGTLEFS